MKKLLFILSLLASFYMISFTSQTTFALSESEFQAGRIIDDSVFFNGNSLDVASIQIFLNSKVPSCDTDGILPHSGSTRAAYGTSRGYPPPYTCLKNYSQDTPTKVAETGLCNHYNGGTKSVAQIIYDVGVACGVNQKALIVLLEKEQSLLTDDWPWSIQYRSATGYGCPDTAPCDTEYYGFFNQVYNAARQFKRYVRDESLFRYRPFRDNYIQYNPNAACGGSNVYIQNAATAALYNYTPYQPNASALANLYGVGDGCGAYGNRNFWRIYNDWFGNTTRSLVSANGVVYLVENGTKRIIPSAAVFASYSFKWSDILFISNAEISLIANGTPLTYNVNYRNGQLVTADGNAVWLVENGTKRIIPSATVFASYSFLKWSNIKYIEPYEISLMPNGAAMFYNVNYRNGQLVTADGNAVWLVENGTKRIIPSATVFASYSFKWSDIKFIQQSEISLLLEGVVLPLKP